MGGIRFTHIGNTVEFSLSMLNLKCVKILMMLSRY